MPLDVEVEEQARLPEAATGIDEQAGADLGGDRPPGFTARSMVE